MQGQNKTDAAPVFEIVVLLICLQTASTVLKKSDIFKNCATLFKEALWGEGSRYWTRSLIEF